MSGNEWLKVAPVQVLVLWHCEHWPAKWLAGAWEAWQPIQFVAPWAAWLKVAPVQALVLWHWLHWPGK